MGALREREYVMRVKAHILSAIHEREQIMAHQDSDKASETSARRLFWASGAFYVLIAFEFFYMASPFAAYFYAVYGPGMDWLQRLGFADWTLWFFLPHIVAETRSGLIDFAETAGLLLFFGGLVAFAIGAFQVYRAKLRKAGEVTRGLHRHVRHPQYTALIVASLGMLLIWPRFLVLFSTVTVIFAYVALARAEERICLRKYPGYRDYMENTGMFLPRGWLPRPRVAIRSRWLGAALWIGAFCLAIGVTTAAAFGLRALAVSSLYTHETPEGVYLSVVSMGDGDLAEVARIARADPAVEAALAGLGETGALLAYVLPTRMHVSEIPMHLPPGESFGHSAPKDREPGRFKVVFTEAEFGADGIGAGEAILARAINKRPLMEVHVDLGDGAVETTFPLPAEPFYADRQVPVF